MELKIKPYPGNDHPLRGLFIRGSLVINCMQEIQALQFKLTDFRIYPVPGQTPDSIGGFLLVSNHTLDAASAGKHQLYQMVSSNLFIPERSTLYPSMAATELEKLFSSFVHIMHPEFGLAELTEELDMETLILRPTQRSLQVTKPKPAVFIPEQILSFQIKPISAEETLKNLEENIFPKKQVMENKPLNLLEKGKLAFYQLLFTRKPNKTSAPPASTEKTKLGSTLDSLLRKIFKRENGLTEQIIEDYENLENRNQKEIDKLMDLFMSNPEEALKYAIPLDNKGSVRGGTNQPFTLSKRWVDLLLSATGKQSSSSGTVDIGDHYFELQRQYMITAQSFLDKKEYQKAAFVYMKLLKDHFAAAQALEKGKLYAEAATIYLKHAHNKRQAAKCFEKGNMTNEAIELYVELNENEKVGDLYLSINKRKEAEMYFEKVINQYTLKHQYVKAALLYKNKMNRKQDGQALLLEGWKKNMDASNCLSNYFSNISNITQLKYEIDNVYKHHLTSGNSIPFLKVIRQEYDKKNELSESIKEIAYEIIAAEIKTNPSIVSELKGFNKNDKELLKDTLRFKTGGKK